ncbi:MAG: hypothetical protein WCK02_12515 [Bacteroidota bacterium]
MTRKLLFVFSFFLLIIASCSRDELTNCNCIGKENTICREVVFNNDVYSGYIEYAYNNFDSISNIKYFSSQANSIKTILFYYDSTNNISHKIFKNSNSFYDELKYAYLDNKINDIYYLSQNDTVYQNKYFYQDNLLKKIEFFSSASADSSIAWTYYSDNKIRHEKHYGNNGMIKYYRFFEYFSNNIDKISIYNSQDSLVEYYTINKNNSSIINTCTKAGIDFIYQTSEYYNDGNLKTRITFNEKGKEVLRIHYLYNEAN